MPDDIARVIARILDGLRPAAGSPRGRPLQIFIAGDQVIQMQGEAATATALGSTTLYGAATYGTPTYGGLTQYGRSRYGVVIYGT